MTASIGMDGLAFLRTVLPAQGVYFAVEIRKSKADKDIYVHTAFHDIPSLHSFFVCEDATGKTMYFAVAAFREPRVWNPNKLNKRTGKRGAWEWRTHANVRALKVLIGEIDTRESKPDVQYADRVEAYSALVAFCEAAELPMPLIVSSGGGLHCYWVLEVEPSPKQWEPLACGLKAAMAHFGLKADPARTSDGSSVLRPAGTHHRKSGRIVEAGELVGPYPLSAFKHLKLFAPKGHRKRSGSSSARSNGLPPIAEAMCANLHDPSDPARIVKVCRQLKGFAEDPSAYSEPFHCAASGVFSHCIDGEEFYLGWLDDDWKDAGREKLNQWLGGGWGPATCQRFEELNPGGCCGCPFKGEITSPIVLGRQYVPIILPDKPPAALP